MERCEKDECNPELMRSIDKVIRWDNPFAAAYTMMGELEQQVKVEGNRLNLIRPNQRTLRDESYLGLADHVNALAIIAGMRAGVSLILPSSFFGSPRAMKQNFQDTMSVVRDFIARIFDIKKKELLQDLKKNGIFGRVVVDIYVIEFQKRGHPHTHLLLIITEQDKIRDSESIDLIVSAELPEKTVDPKLHEIVNSIIIHGPCGALIVFAQRDTTSNLVIQRLKTSYV
ncbi:ATP-dependent DNA helicase [Trichonephila inaurata madagascariensis]|uniref:ATP-dependent DNA helicase n=1 Tax=Trichonephila inaurata madagascariensis TaxID=2747483 RepID=A0A8X6YQC9_9ARAC|nr:ATP-dependent DNA helicase [Trichonephila inaurata madagascariensis]